MIELLKLKLSAYLGMLTMFDMVSKLSLPTKVSLINRPGLVLFSLSSFLRIGKVSPSMVCYQMAIIIVG